MLHPSYSDLMKVVNDNTEDDAPVVNSRYSIVMATAKRARQIIGDETNTTEAERAKPLSTAVRELNEGSLRIIAAETDDEDDIAIAVSEAVHMIAASEEDEDSSDDLYADGEEDDTDADDEDEENEETDDEDEE